MAAGGLQRHRQRLAVGREMQRHARVRRHQRGDNVDRRGLPVHRRQQAVVNEVGQADAGGIAVAVQVQAADINPFDGAGPGQDKAALGLAPNHVGVQPRAAEVLAHFIHDQQVHILERQTGHQATRLVQELHFVLFHRGRGDGDDASGLVQRVLEDADAEGKFAEPEHLARDWQQRRRVAQADGGLVKLVGPLLFAQADCRHLHQPALDRSMEISVWFDAVDRDNGVGASGLPVLINDELSSAAQFNHLHAAFHRNADCALGDSVMGQHVHLAGGGGPAVAAHGRHNEHLGPEPL